MLDGIPAAMSATTVIDGVEQVADLYDGWIFDVWGTLYDGGVVFPEALGVLRRLAERGAAVAVLSNSPRLEGVVAERLDGLGIDRELYRAVVTSGGESHRHLIERPDPFHAGLGPKVHTFAPTRFADILPGTGFELVSDLAAADWLLNAGTEEPFDTVALYEDRLRQGVDLGLPMLCANPDHAVFDRGVRRIHAGALAARYAELGGDVHYHGKPYAPVFQRSLELLGTALKRTVMVGDNRATDIAGAAAMGMDSILLADGMHRDRLLVDDRLDGVRLDAFLDEKGAAPRWVDARLRWAV